MAPFTAAAAAKPARLAQLDSMRGLAALVVTLGHLHQLFLPDGARVWLWRAADALPKRLLDTAAAVDFFFVLSGFVLALPYLARPARPLALDVFFVRRILRIMPTYWAGLVVALVLRAFTQPFWGALGFHLHMHWETPLTGRDVSQAFVLVGGLDPSLINGPVWSLAVEMQISLLLPLVIALFAARPRLRDGLLILVVLAAAPYFGGTPGGASCIRFWPLFGLGVFAASLAPDVTERLRTTGPWLYRGLLLLSVALLWNRSLMPQWQFPDMRHEYLTALGSALVILLAVARAETFSWLDGAVARYLGDISYSLYLIHLPILLAAASFLRARGVGLVPSALVAVSLAFLGAAGLHHLVERPSLGWVRQAGRWVGTARGSLGRPAAP